MTGRTRTVRCASPDTLDQRGKKKKKSESQSSAIQRTVTFPFFLFFQLDRNFLLSLTSSKRNFERKRAEKQERTESIFSRLVFTAHPQSIDK